MPARGGRALGPLRAERESSKARCDLSPLRVPAARRTLEDWIRHSSAVNSNAASRAHGIAPLLSHDLSFRRSPFGPRRGPRCLSFAFWSASSASGPRSSRSDSGISAWSAYGLSPLRGRRYRGQGGVDPVPARACAVVGPGRDLPADLYLEGSEDRMVMLMERPAPSAAHSTHRQGSSNFCRCRGLEQRCRCRPTIRPIRCAVHSPGECESLVTMW